MTKSVLQVSLGVAAMFALAGIHWDVICPPDDEELTCEQSADMEPEDVEVASKRPVRSPTAGEMELLSELNKHSCTGDCKVYIDQKDQPGSIRLATLSAADLSDRPYFVDNAMIYNKAREHLCYKGAWCGVSLVVDKLGLVGIVVDSAYGDRDIIDINVRVSRL